MDISKTNLKNANLYCENLRGKCLVGASLNNAYMVKADLRGSDLSRSVLEEANLQQADLRGAILVRANMLEADISGADFRGADLTGAVLVEAYAAETRFRGANLPRVNLSNANCRKCDFRGANLSDANLTDTDLAGANLKGALLYGVVGLSSMEEEIEECKRILDILESGQGLIDMGVWHTCDTVHCLAGWVVPDVQYPQAIASRVIPSLAWLFYQDTMPQEEVMEYLSVCAGGQVLER